MKTKRKGLFIILSSPSGAGKTSLAKKLLKNSKNIELSISYTTRKKRPLEKNSKDYNFISKEKKNL
jgi:guanylate kinase